MFSKHVVKADLSTTSFFSVLNQSMPRMCTIFVYYIFGQAARIFLCRFVCCDINGGCSNGAI